MEYGKCILPSSFFLNPFNIFLPYIQITNSELLFEQERMAHNWDKYDIEVQNDHAIKHIQIFFYYMQQTFNRLGGLYLHEAFLLVDKMMKDQLRN